MTYFPSAFWPRMITRLLGDGKTHGLLLSLFPGLPRPTIANSQEGGGGGGGGRGRDESGGGEGDGGGGSSEATAVEWHCWKVTIYYVINI